MGPWDAQPSPALSKLSYLGEYVPSAPLSSYEKFLAKNNTKAWLLLGSPHVTNICQDACKSQTPEMRGSRLCLSFLHGLFLMLLSKRRKQSIKYTRSLPNDDQHINPISIPNKHATHKLSRRKCHTENVDVSDWNQTGIVISNQVFDMEGRLACLN